MVMVRVSATDAKKRSMAPRKSRRKASLNAIFNVSSLTLSKLLRDLPTVSSRLSLQNFYFELVDSLPSESDAEYFYVPVSSRVGGERSRFS